MFVTCQTRNVLTQRRLTTGILLSHILRSILSFALLPPASLFGLSGLHANLLHGKAVSVSEQLTLPFVTCDESLSEVKSANHPVAESKALPPVSDSLSQVKGISLSGRVLARLEQFEAHEVNLHFKSDYRQSWITISFAQKDIPEPFVAASYQIYGVHPDEVWPHVIADRKSRLGQEYFNWYDSAGNMRPDIPKIPPVREPEFNPHLEALMNLAASASAAAAEPAAAPKPAAGSVPLPRKEIV